MPRPQAKSFATPDDVKTTPNVRFETISLNEATIGQCRFEPGWRWSTEFGSQFGQTSCPIRHVGYTISGTTRVRMDDGETLDIGPGMVFDVPGGHDQWVVGNEAWVAIEWGASGLALREALQETPSRSMATVVFTDIVDSTARLEQVGDAAWRDLLAVHDVRMREQLNVFRGREVKTTGDGFLAVFDSPTRAVRCAASMVRAVGAVGLHIRVGVHSGEIESVGEDVRGIAVHVAARLLALARADEVMVSQTTTDLVEGSGLEFEDTGAFELKGLSGTRRVFRLTVPESRA